MRIRRLTTHTHERDSGTAVIERREIVLNELSLIEVCICITRAPEEQIERELTRQLSIQEFGPLEGNTTFLVPNQELGQSHFHITLEPGRSDFTRLVGKNARHIPLARIFSSRAR